MSSPLYVAGDWGTSHLRLYLCQAAQVLERLEGPGVAALSSEAPGAFANVLNELCARWTQAHGALAVWLSGMIGSRTGWREAPYVACPADARSVMSSMLRFESGGRCVTIVPGLSCSNPHGAPDVLRGEETQIFGAMACHAHLAHGTHVMALPGTHAKWALVTDGRVVQFQTSLSGELFALLNGHSTLAVTASRSSPEPGSAVQGDPYEQGLARARDLVATPLHHLLFETRSRQLVGEFTGVQAMRFLSGLIIGQDVLGALRLFQSAPGGSGCITLVGAPEITQLYRSALGGHGITALEIDASTATVAGLQAYATLAS